MNAAEASAGPADSSAGPAGVPTAPPASPAGVPGEAYAAALSMLPGCGQQRLRRLLAAAPPDEVWRAVGSGRLMRVQGAHEAMGRGGDALAARWRSMSAGLDPAAVWAGLAAEGMGVWVIGAAGYPHRLVDDPDPPPILFWRGDAAALDRPAVAVIGTRRCTSYGSDVARSFGRALAEAGVSVVSGLALGIDGAAHEGAMAVSGAPPIAVVGSGLDVVYPTRHRSLWARVRQAGLVVSESPPGAAPEAWRFPLRNRVLAALAHVVVVVESHAGGGSMSTVRAAAERGIPVMAVPGSVRSPSSAGTNRLLADGSAPALDIEDVLVALSLEGVALAPPLVSTDRPLESGPAGQRPQVPDEDVPGDWVARASDVGVTAGSEPLPEKRLLAAVDWTPTSTETVLRRTGLALGAASVGLRRLERSGELVCHGAWWQRAFR